MSSRVVRLGLLSGAAILLLGVIAWAEDGKKDEPAEREHVDLFVSVEGRTIVLTSLPEGTRVEKGDAVCELDTSELKDRLATQEIVVRGAEAEVHATRIAREAAFMAVREYKEGTFRQELATTEGEIKLAEARLASAEDHLAWCQRMFAKRCYELAIRLRDQAFERLHEPPRAVVTSRSALVTTLLEQLTEVRLTQDRLIGLWTSFRAERLALYRDLGEFPYSDWKTFYADLSTGPAPAADVPDAPPQPPAGR